MQQNGIQLIGDIPIFVSADSADVWANPELFLLDADRRPLEAGVPPDYFSATGQLWGNPLYDWTAHEKTNYAWWVARSRRPSAWWISFGLDHFRGFEAAWHVKAGQPTAEGANGSGPGTELFRTLRKNWELAVDRRGSGPHHAGVEKLRNDLGLPGMRILQFAFDSDSGNRFLPHHYDRNTVAYTGTHDNDTTSGWFRRRPEHRALCPPLSGPRRRRIAWDLIRRPGRPSLTSRWHPARFAEPRTRRHA